RKKYGYRADHRPKVVQRLLTELKRHVSEDLQVLSDQNPKYPVWIKTQFPNATHETTKGRRGCVTGQGELKALQWDPLFALNHTAAMLRANMNRLFRKTWCTTKTPQGLKNHIDIYINFHNNVLTA
ncbi:MAG: transposase, partial [Bdellovibrionales bacterium]|nr:transposase [Bdellovibrionales bacterium]